MKKKLLFAIAGLITFGANAQNELSPVFVAGKHEARVPVLGRIDPSSPSRNLNAATAGKGTATSGGRWLGHFEAVNELTSSGIENNSYVFPIWFDSTVLQRFSNGSGGFVYDNINFSSVNQHLDPSHFQVYNTTTIGGGMYTGQVEIKPTTPYRVDSINIVAAYVRKTSKPNIVDTLIFSVAPSAGAYYWRKSNPQTAWAGNYLTGTQDTLWGFSALKVDSVNRSAESNVTGVSRITWKKILTAADGDTATAAGFRTRNFTEAVPNGGLNVPAGTDFNISVTFKSGDTWVKNVDSVNTMNYFQPVASAAAPNQRMPYYYYDYNDRNMSDLMFSTDTTSYRPVIGIEGTNTIGFSQEFLWISGYIYCQSCELVNVKDRSGIISEVGNAYPNPAVSQVTVPFTLKESANVTVNVSNTLGQVLKTQAMGRISSGKAVFNTSDLASGFYFVTVEANGQRVTNRFVVSH